MPIKFRCQHCRQFLGISRSKAGAVVDCPTCGRALRVPRLDGSVDPLPEPGMDLRDSRLSQALDELAQIADDGLLQAAERDDRAGRRRNAALATQDESDPVELPPLPDPVAIEPPSAAEPVSSPGGLKVKAAAAAKPPSTSEQSDEADNPILERARRSTAISDEIIEMVQSASAIVPVDEAPAPAPRPVVPRRSWAQAPKRLSRRAALAALLCGVGVLAFAAGFLSGRLGRLTGSPAQGQSSASAAGTASEQPSAGIPAGGLAGRITVETDRNGVEPDDGARIVAVPADRPPDQRLPADLLLDHGRQAEAASQLQAHGGAFTVAAADGTFALELPQAGRYRVLVISSQKPLDDAPLPAAAAALAGEWLDQPDFVIQRRRCLAREIRYAGEGRLPFDCVFQHTP